MALYTAELRWGQATISWKDDPQIRMTCRHIADIDRSLAHLLSFVPTAEYAVLQVVADTEYGTFTLAEFTGGPADLEAHYLRGRHTGFQAHGVTATGEESAAASYADSPPA